MERDTETGIALAPLPRRFTLVAFALAAALLLAMLGELAGLIDHRLIRLSIAISPATLIAAALAYLAGHVIRIVRLALLIGDSRLSLRQLIAVHFFTSAVNLGLPFKLGELYRIGELSTVAFGAFNALVAVWVERCFDISLVLLLLLLAIGFGPASSGAYLAVLLISLLFVTVTLVVVTLVPDNLRRLGNHIIRRYEADWTIEALRRIAQARGLFRQLSRMLQGRYASLAVCTLMIWMFEGLSLALILIGRATPSAPITGLLTFLSSTVEGQTLPTRFAALRMGEVTEMTMTYLMATQIPLLFAGLAAGIFLARQRIRLMLTLGRMRRKVAS
ncbi:MAG: hypothetical protein JWR77_183 [Rhizorhabdus sp.]|nr:hypothetical protein [Rhizorhabdus sp.]